MRWTRKYPWFSWVAEVVVLAALWIFVTDLGVGHTRTAAGSAVVLVVMTALFLFLIVRRLRAVRRRRGWRGI